MLTIIIVSYNTRELLRRCIASVHASLAGAAIRYAIIVVDNASADGTPAMLRADHPEVCLLEPGRNLGFAGGNNLALRRVLSFEDSVIRSSENAKRKTQNAKPDYVLLLNPDTEIVGDAIARLVRYLDAHPDVAVVGPQLRYADGSAQPSRRRVPTRATFFFESTPLANYWPNNRWARRYRCADTPDDVEQPVDWLVGAALLVRCAAIAHAGLLDAGFHMYSEELEWQQRIQGIGDREQETEDRGQGDRERGRQGERETGREGDREIIGNLLAYRLPSRAARVVYLPDAVITHHEGQSSAQAPARRYVDFHRSRLRYARLRYGARFARCLRWFIVAAFGAELCVEAAKWLLGHRRDLRAARVRVYWQVVQALCVA